MDENQKLKNHITEDADRLSNSIKELREASEAFTKHVWGFIGINYGKLVVIAIVVFLGAYSVYANNTLEKKVNTVINGIYTEDNTLNGGNPRHSVLPYSASYQWEMERRELKAQNTLESR